MDLVELLLRYGAAVNVIDGDARTPLMLAARCGNAPLVELFLEYGAKRDMVDNSSKFFFISFLFILFSAVCLNEVTSFRFYSSRLCYQ